MLLQSINLRTHKHTHNVHINNEGSRQKPGTPVVVLSARHFLLNLWLPTVRYCTKTMLLRSNILCLPSYSFSIYVGTIWLDHQEYTYNLLTNHLTYMESNGIMCKALWNWNKIWHPLIWPECIHQYKLLLSYFFNHIHFRITHIFSLQSMQTWIFLLKII